MPNKRDWIGAGLVAVVAAAVTHVALPDRGAPLWLVRAVVGSTTALDYHGGARLHYQAPDEHNQADVAAAERMLATRARSLDPHALVARRAYALTVTLAGEQLATADLERTARALAQRGELAVTPVLEDTPLARGLFARAEQIGGAVAGELDFWVHDRTGRQYRDVYVMAEEASTLEAFVADAAREDPALAPSPGEAIALERVTGFDGDVEVTRFWRTYVVERAPALTGADVVGANVLFDPVTTRPQVLLDLGQLGGRKFYELTARIAGRKLAILLDGVVASAPVVQERIPGGRAAISLAGTDPATMLLEAEALIAVLSSSRTGAAMPIALRVTNTERVPARVTNDQLTTVRAASAAGVGVLAALVFLLIGIAAGAAARLAMARPRSSSDRAAFEPIPAATGTAGWPVLRLVITAAVMLAVYLSPRVMLPTVEEEALAALLSAGGGSVDTTGFSVFALGLMPILSAFVLVELAALAVPAWRPLRGEGPDGGERGRGRLVTATLALSLALALLHGWLLAVWMESLGSVGGFMMENVLRTDIPAVRLVTALSLAAGVAVWWIAAAVIGRHGLGNGFSVLILAGVLSEIRTLYEWTRLGDVAPVGIALVVLAAAAAIAATTRLLRGPAGADRVVLPTCGAVPLTWHAAVVALLSTLAPTSWFDSRLGAGVFEAMMWWSAPSGSELGRAVANLVVVAGLAVGLSWLFSRPSLTAEADARARGERGAADLAPFWRATVVSAGFVVALAVLELLAARAGAVGLDLIAFVVATAVVMDLGAEWQARRRDDWAAVWPLHRVQALAPICAVLGRLDIPVFARGARHRALLYFFGPFVPIAIMVPADRAGEAHAAIAALFTGDDTGEGDASDEDATDDADDDEDDDAGDDDADGEDATDDAREA